jgi:hypothetical protein
MFKDLFKDLDKRELAARAVMGFFAGGLGTYLNRVLVRVVEVWPVFHFRSAGPMVTLLAQDWPLMAKASLIFGCIYAIFCMAVPKHLAAATVFFMGVLVVAGRAYVIDGLQIANVYDDLGWIAMHALVRAVLIILVYWLLQTFIAGRFRRPASYAA